MSKNSIIFDLDGTIAIIDKRRRLSTNKNGKINWELFFDSKNIKLDEPNIPVIKSLQLFKERGYKIFILSGRLETTKDATLQWLEENNVEFDDLKMRKSDRIGKFISDVELKENWLNEIGKENILCVFDDRTKIVEMWRKNGLVCFQVNDGNF